MNTKTLDDAQAALSEIYDQLRTGAIDVETAKERRKPLNEVIKAEQLRLKKQITQNKTEIAALRRAKEDHSPDAGGADVSGPSDLNVYKLLKSESERAAERGADIKRLRVTDGEMPADISAALNAEADREAEKAAALKRLRQIEARK